MIMSSPGEDTENRNTHMLLVRIQNGISSMENSLEL